MDDLIQSLSELIPEQECEPFCMIDGRPVIIARTDTASLIRTYICYGPLTDEQWAHKAEQYPHLFAPLQSILDGHRWSSWTAFERTCWSADWRRQLELWVQIRITSGHWLSRKDARERGISLAIIEQGAGQTPRELKQFYTQAIAAAGLLDCYKENAN